jgi:hypothetical protein
MTSPLYGCIIDVPDCSARCLKLGNHHMHRSIQSHGHRDRDSLYVMRSELTVHGPWDRTVESGTGAIQPKSGT